MARLAWIAASVLLSARIAAVQALSGLHSVLHFPEHPGLVLPVGERVDALLGLRSELDAPMNVSLAVGSVHHPEAFAFQIQNLTAQTFGVELAAGEALTLPYSFFLSPQLGGGPNPRYTLAVVVYYNDVSGRVFGDAVFNRTVEVFEPSTTTGDIVTVVGTLAVLAAFFFGLGKLVVSPSSGASSSGKAPSVVQKVVSAPAMLTATKAKGAPEGVNEWLIGTSAHPGKKDKSKKDKKR